MNSLIIFPEELISKERAILNGDRARQVIQLHDLKLGLKIRTAVFGGDKGNALIVNLTAERIELQLLLDDAPLQPMPISMIVAVPRPQTLKKILQASATLGVHSLHLIRSAEVEKSYLDSHSLHPEQVRQHLALGLEQNMDSFAPEVRLHTRFRPFVEDFLQPKLQEPGTSLLVLDPRHPKRQRLTNVIRPAPEFQFVAIGPEAGWNDYELECFQNIGASFVDLGPRILRVETAFIFAVAQLSLNIRA